jgi:hypothetical protein
VTRPRPFQLAVAAVVAVAALVTLALAGCGGSQDPGTVLEQTFGARTKPIHSGRLDLHLDVEGQGLGSIPAPLSIRLSGPFASSGGGRMPKFDLDLDVRTGGGAVRLGGISTGDRGWLVFQDRAYTLTGDLFRRLDRSRRDALAPSQGGSDDAGGSPLRALGIDPRRWLRDSHTVGDETLAGEDVVHVRAGVDVARLLGDVQRLLAKAGATGTQAPATLTPQARSAIQRAVRDATVDVYSGREDHILRRIALDVRYASGGRSGRVRLAMGIAAVNAPQPIGPPASARPISELEAALQRLGATLRRQQDAGVAGARGDAYQRCLAAAAGDLAKAQACADLVGR